MKFKKMFILLVALFMFLPTLLFAQGTSTCNDELITIRSITLERKDEGIAENASPTIVGKTIKLDLTANEIGSEIVYKMIVANGSEEDYAAYPAVDSTDYVTYSIVPAEINLIPAGETGIVYLHVEYTSQIPASEFTNGTYQDNGGITVDLTTDIENTTATDTTTNTNTKTNTKKDTVTNPKTGTQGALLFIIVAIFMGSILYVVFARNKVIRHLVVILGLAVIVPLTIYAACECELTVESKVTIEQNSNTSTTPTTPTTPTQPETTSGLQGLKNSVVTSGTGLYKIGNRYVFKGSNPNNYITDGNNNLYRIIAIEENDVLKVIRANPIGTITYDPGYTTGITGITSANSLEKIRTGGSDDLCYASNSQNYVGCKSWGSSDSTYQIVNGNPAKVTTFPKGTYIKNLPGSDAYLNAYLNGGTFSGTSITGWFTNNNVITSLAVNSRFYIGSVDNAENQTLQTDINQEKDYFWNGKVGLMNTSDYVNASSNSACDGVYNYINTNSCYSDSASHNYLTIGQPEWTLNSVFTSNSKIWAISSSGRLEDSENAQEAKAVRPVLYINLDRASIEGQGTQNSPFNIITLG